jgi:hypothetical protein
MCLRKRPGHHVLSIGDKIRVAVEEVRVEDGEITFSPA